MLNKKISKLFYILPLVFGLAACGEKDDTQVIKVGATVGPHAEVVEAVAVEAAKQGLKVEVVIFSDYITPNAALADGSLDLNSYQHQPFMKTYLFTCGRCGISLIERPPVFSSTTKRSIRPLSDF